MTHDMLQQAASNAMAMGPAVLLQGMELQRPIDVVRAPALSVDDKRTILAAWASDFYAVDSIPLSGRCRECQSRFRSMRYSPR
ncbi:UNVERIFIED_ORG: hypothetical protein M2435_004933 [Rhizobium sophorae]|nr:hypothetical protein RLV_0504 [Rhizobium leguminosarum bv. viciae]MBB4524808.1 hypothetical protein [Rhizobium leguminosarum]MDH6662010.1 hypothetical protein [Rhizobium sophorae]